MTKRKTAYALPEERSRPDTGSRPSAYGYEIRCSAVALEEDVLHVQMKFPENSRSPTKTLDLAKAYLPSNRLHPSVTLLKDRPELARIVVAVVDTYVLRQQSAKSTATTAIIMAANIVRTLEYFWLNDIYDLKDATDRHWDDLLDKYVSGGWYLALELERRASLVDLKVLTHYRRRGRQHEYSCASFLEAIGTNVATSQVQLEWKTGEEKGKLVRVRGDEAPSESVIQQFVSHLNNLALLPKDLRASRLLHVNPYLFAQSTGARRKERTENFEPAKLAALLCEAYRWVAVYADPIVRLANRVYTDLTEYEMEEIDESRLFLVLAAPEAKELEELLGVPIATVRRMGDWSHSMGLLGLIRTLMASCFVLLGVFNGRRKDEIQSRAIGVYADGFECIDSELAIFQSYFYCEKSHHEYRQFYVNEISFKALQTLRALSEVTWRQVVRNGGDDKSAEFRKLFCLPPNSVEQSPVWYEYSSDPGITLLTQRATGSAENVVPNAHMFRRAYAVVFYYRYENADLYALSQQLAHRDLEMTIHYVLEGPSRVLAHHAARLWGDGGQSKKARAEKAVELAAEIKGYGKIKLHDDIAGILSGQISVAGGFPRLVERFARKLMGRITYDDASLRSAARKVTDALLHRGHSVTPFAHGNCNAGAPRVGAKCYTNERLARELASPAVCGSCPYHQMKEVHLRAVEDDLAKQREALDKRAASLLSSPAKAALEATEALVSFYHRRLSKTSAARGVA